jgi:hypothetical protein
MTKSERRAYIKRWHRRNRASRQAYLAVYQATHKEEANARAKAWYKANKRRAKLRISRWAKKNPKKIKFYRFKRRHKASVWKARHYAQNRKILIAKSRRWAKENPAERKRIARLHARNKVLQRLGIVQADVDSTREKQNNACAICNRKFRGKKVRPNIDHCHRTGKFRGLLCQWCNPAIGMLQDSEKVLKSAIQYLRKSNVK